MVKAKTSGYILPANDLVLIALAPPGQTDPQPFWRSFSARIMPHRVNLMYINNMTQDY